MAPSAALRRAGRRLRGAQRTAIQVAIAVGASWALATAVLGQDRPFFAPIAAVIVLNSPVQRGRRALELVIGVATGIAVADLLVLAIGTGGWQLVVVGLLAMLVVTAAGGGPLVVSQATVAAILVVALQPPTLDLVPHRFFHAVTGGATALGVAALLPPAPDRQLSRATQPLLGALVTVLIDVAGALRQGDLAAGQRALDTARGLDAEVGQLRVSVDIARETARLAPLRRGQRDLVDAYADAVGQLDLAVRDTRVLARASVALLQHQDDGDHPGPPPPELAIAVLDLAEAVRALGRQLTEGGPADATRLHAGAAAARTRGLFADGRALAISRVVGQIRSTGIDLLRCSGLEIEEAQHALYAAPAPAPRSPNEDEPGGPSGTRSTG